MNIENYIHVKHEFDPVYDEQSKVLILGTFPSVKSREQQFYYGHRQNRFWKLLAALYGEQMPVDIPEKKKFLLRNRIAIWDVIAECDIIGSSDSSIRNVVPTDVSSLLKKTDIQAVFANGATAYKLYQKYSFPLTRKEIVPLPSTSPANASFSLNKLMEEWGEYFPYD